MWKLPLLSLLCVFFSSAVFSYSLSSSGHSQINLDDKTYSVPGKNPLDFCADPKDYILNIDHVDLSPNPPKSGTTLTIQAKGNVTAKIDSGAHALLSVKLRLNYGGQIPILQRDEDLCELLEKDTDIDKKCPIEKDDSISFTKKIEVPERVPKGKFVVLIDALTKNEKKISCLMTEIQFT